MVQIPSHGVRYTYAEYVALEASSNIKHEFLDGRIYAMAGGTPDHAALAATVVGLIFGQLEGRPCRVHSSDLRIRILATGLATYPDVSVVCGTRELDPNDAQAVTNPTLVVEVLSPSTADYDRGDKLAHYQRVLSMRQVVLIAHDRRLIQVWTRGADDAWSLREAVDGDRAELGSIGCTLEVRRLYEASGR